MQHYEVAFEDDVVIIRRIMDERGDVFTVQNNHKEHVGTLITGTVEATYASDGHVVIFQAGESTPVRIGDSWTGVSLSDYTVTECRLDATDENTWLEVGMPREQLEKMAERGGIIKKFKEHTKTHANKENEEKPKKEE